MDDVLLQIDELCKLAMSRIPKDISGLCCAEIFWLTDEEVRKLYDLKMQLPSAAQCANESRERVYAKHAKIRSRSSGHKPQGAG